jgi:valyl-tRNA synthetase
LLALDNKETVVLGAGQDKILRHWLKNLKDWNISRNIVWGIQIPAWYSPDGKYVVSIEKPEGEWREETDTFDTWFSSGQWPVVTLKTNSKADFDKFYPTTIMETGYDILPFWVMRMMLLGIYMTGKSPFKTVYLHGLVRDEKGRKMSKSVGNVINPLEIVEKYGTDALRFALVMSSTPAVDKSVGEGTFKGMRNFSNKIWNATRFVKDFSNNAEDNIKFNKKYLEELPKQIANLLDKFKIGLAAEILYDNFWHKFCDIEIERAKKNEVSSKQLTEALNTLLKLLHPFMPFVTEACWKNIGNDSLLMTSSWPSMSNGQKEKLL